MVVAPARGELAGAVDQKAPPDPAGLLRSLRNLRSSLDRAPPGSHMTVMSMEMVARREHPSSLYHATVNLARRKHFLDDADGHLVHALEHPIRQRQLVGR